MKFKIFMILYFALVILVTVCSLGIGQMISQYIMPIAFMTSTNIFGVIIGRKLYEKIAKATQEELNREDDILLQATAFSHAVLVILLSQLSSERLKGAILYLVVVVGVTFYALRAWAKIKNSQKYRYYSMIIFAFLTANAVLSLLKLSLNLPDVYIFDLSYVYVGISTTFAIIAEHISRKRYGYKGIVLVMD
jgi:hypothetical protein